MRLPGGGDGRGREGTGGKESSRGVRMLWSIGVKCRHLGCCGLGIHHTWIDDSLSTLKGAAEGESMHCVCVCVGGGGGYKQLAC